LREGEEQSEEAEKKAGLPREISVVK